MEQKKIVSRRFKFMADFICSWGWQTDIFDDGTIDYYGMDGDFETEIDNGEQAAKISPVLTKAIQKWGDYYDNYAFDSLNNWNNKMDWHTFHVNGIRLMRLLATQIGHLYEEIYYRGSDGSSRRYVDVYSKRKRNVMENGKFMFMADFGGCWGWSVEEKEYACCACNYEDEIYGVKISPVLARAIEKWQKYFERYAYDDYCARNSKDFASANFDWENWDKAGIRLARLLKMQIGHLFDGFYYEYAFEDKNSQKVYRKASKIIIE